MIFNTTVQGIPCQCQVTMIGKNIPMKRYGSGAGDVHPPEHQEMEIALLDRQGKPADWLEKKLTVSERDRLKKEFFLERDAEMYAYSH